MPPVFLAALLYIGAGIGMAVINLIGKKQTQGKEARITRRELPYIVAMVCLDMAAPILLMVGLSLTTPATASLLNNFEIVATAVIALVIFKEAVGKRMWIAIGLILIGSAILTIEDYSGFVFSAGAVFVLLACACWGIENNCTRMLSSKNPLQIIVIKGIGSGCGALLIAVFTHGVIVNILLISVALLLGFIAYGLSIYFYILAQRNLGAIRTSAFYAIAPFIGVGLSFIMFRDTPARSFYIALAVMFSGVYLALSEKHEHQHTHEALEHEHRHNHSDGHHTHVHTPSTNGEHNHRHEHSELTHRHAHTPDLYHMHKHLPQ